MGIVIGGYRHAQFRIPGLWQALTLTETYNEFNLTLNKPHSNEISKPAFY